MMDRGPCRAEVYRKQGLFSLRRKRMIVGSSDRSSYSFSVLRPRRWRLVGIFGVLFRKVFSLEDEVFSS